MTARARVVLAATVAAGAVLPGLVAAGAAHAAAYRYWTYWTGGPSGWTFASSGPAYRVPADGTVEGWRFAVSEVSGGDRPRVDAAGAFGQLCGATPAEAGRKRVAVVLDTGEPADAPPGETPPAPRGTCVVAEPDATGYAVLRAAATVRVEGGLVCGIDGYPARECAAVVASAPAGTPSPTRSPSSQPRPSTQRPSAGSSSPESTTPRAAPTPAATSEAATAGGGAEPGTTPDPPASVDAEPIDAEPAGEATEAPSLAWATDPPAGTDPQASPVALVTGSAAPPAEGGSPLPVLLVAAGAGLLGTAAWLRTRRRSA